MEHNDFYSIRIGLASPEMIHEWSYGEVTKPETINYRSQKPEEFGLFCERIFGPTKDGTCACGKYKGSHNKTVITCEKCGVDVTTKKVRRERLGHIDLATPVSHIWYFKATPSRMATILDMSPKALEQVLYYAQYVVTDPGQTDLEPRTVMTEDELTDALGLYGEGTFEYGMGAGAVMKLLQQIDCEALVKELKDQIATTPGAGKVKLIKRLDVVEAFRASGNKPEWMVLTCIPVLPPEIRPMVQLDGGRFASSDLNELYRRVIYRNNRLKVLLDKDTPEIIVRNERRMVQEAVDALIDNGKRGKAITGASNRALKSLSEMLRGKQGRFRQNLLGKRVDYSGRSVIVVGPSLKIYQCGLPKEMAIELFKPFVIKRMVEMGDATNMKDAQKKIERAYDPANAKVWDALENVIKEHPVLLNRAPTLHRLSIQAFEPVLVDGKAIKLHPLVCPAFNADFDGDQMPVHVPLSSEAQAEARFLMLSANNLLKPMDGKAVTVPSQDMILGAYYLTMEKAGEPGENSVFRNFEEAEMAYSQGFIDYHTPINVRGEITTADGEKKTGIFRAYREENGKKIVHCTLGRLIYNKVVPQNLGFVNRNNPENDFILEINQVVKKKVLGKMIDSCIRYNGPARCATMLDDIKALGYQYSTKASFSISVYDMTIPETKQAILDKAQEDVDQLNEYFELGLFSEDERYHAVIDRWELATKELTADLNKSFSDFNSIKIMADSGARGSEAQMRQLGGMRGLMFATNGKTIEIPIKSNFREGLNVTEYFMGAKGSRKSLSDTALRTADSGYLTRRLVDVSSSVIISEVKCDTQDGFIVEDIIDENSKTVLEPLSERIVGRYAMGDVLDPASGSVIVHDDEMIDEEAVKKIENAGIKQVQIRSAITCHASHGVCAHCYGADMSNGKLVSVGEAVGIIAAQSIGEPGTQLTMRTFHSGGVAGSNITQGLPRVEELFEARTPKKPATVTEIAGKVHIEQNENNVHIITVTPDSLEASVNVGGEKKYTIPYGTELCITEGKHVEAGEPLTEGNIKPDDVLKILGLKTTYDYIIKEVQKVYRAQSCNVNDKHVEIIARQMTRKVDIKNAGDTHLIEGSTMDISDMEDANKAALAEFQFAQENGKLSAESTFTPAVGERKLLGITKAALQTESFLSAASFQETTRVLTDAAIHGKTDYLRGLKENVIIGKLIPAGTGMKCYKNIDVERVQPEEPEEDVESYDEYDEAN